MDRSAGGRADAREPHRRVFSAPKPIAGPDCTRQRDLTVLRPSGLIAAASTDAPRHAGVTCAPFVQRASWRFEAVRPAIYPLRPRGRLFDKVALRQRAVTLAASGPRRRCKRAARPAGAIDQTPTRGSPQAHLALGIKPYGLHPPLPDP
jgi:hypothetical protein